MAQEETVQVTPEEIIHLILDEMEAGMCPSYYSNLVPSIYDVYLSADDLDRLRPLERRIRQEGARALTEKLTRLNRSARSKLKVPLVSDKKPEKRYEALGEWSISFHENTEDPEESPLVIHSTFPRTDASDDRAGTMTERIVRRRSDGQTTTTATLPAARVETQRTSTTVYATIEYEDDTGAHEYQITKDHTKIGRGSADRWVDLKLNTRKDVSREHVQIRRDPSTGKFFIKDLSSLGTTVNGKPLSASIEQVNGEDVDRNIETPLPSKARIGLADVLFLEFRAKK